MTAMRFLVFAQGAMFHSRRLTLRHAALAKNSSALAFGTGWAAALGFIYWWLAARSFPAEVIGTASALLALMSLIGHIGEAGLGTLLTGEIIQRPARPYGLIAAAAIVATVLSIAAGGLALLLMNILSGTLVDTTATAELWLIIGCGLTGLGFVIDQALVGMLRSAVRMLRQLLFSICKLAFLAIAVLWWSGESTILLTWVAAQMMSLVALELWERKRSGSLMQLPDFRHLHSLRRKVADHYMLDLSYVAPAIVMPYLVTILLSPTSNAAFSVIWMILSVATIVPGALATVLFPVARAEPERYRDNMLLSMAVSLAFGAVCGLLIMEFSSDILRIFNPVYAEIGGDSLRLLGFGVIGVAIKSHVCTGARVRNSMRQASLWFLVGALFELACAVAGRYAGGLEGLVVGWVGGVLFEGVALLLMALRVTAWNWAELAGS